MKIETRIELNRFKPRHYQIPLFKAIEKDHKKRAILVWHRRAGKDVACFNLMIRQALLVIGTYYYILPTYRQARLVLFEGMTNDGDKFLDYIPQELIEKINIAEMKIRFKNGSTICFLGSENYDSLRGSNAKGIVFSEYAYQHPQVYATLRPILVANDGWAVFISTPFGENHFYQLYEVAKQNPVDWFVDFLTVEDTNVVAHEVIEQEEREGLMSPDMIRQEYYCEFSVGATGSYYASYLNRMELNGQIDTVPWEPGFPVHTAWDLGMRDQTVILFFQCVGKTVNIIDLYANQDVGLAHYVHYVLGKEYTYGKHMAPHDIRVRDLTGGGKSRWDMARDLGLTFDLAPELSIVDGIETVRTTLPKVWIDRDKCKKLISAIRDYRKEYDSKNKVYRSRPLHDYNSNYCDALRYLCVALPKIRTTSNPEELEKRYRETVYGNDLPGLFSGQFDNNNW